jgi:hypothetical protein
MFFDHEGVEWAFAAGWTAWLAIRDFFMGVDPVGRFW